MIPQVSAHALHLFVLTDGQRILGQAYFGEGVPAIQEAVILYDAASQILDQTQTDQQGRFSFEISQRQLYRVVIEAMEGHRAEHVLVAQDIPEPMLHQHKTDYLTLTRLIQQEIHPLREQLHRYTTRIYWHDVIGGIGYIFGIAGLIFFLRTKRMLKEQSPKL